MARAAPCVVFGGFIGCVADLMGHRVDRVVHTVAIGERRHFRWIIGQIGELPAISEIDRLVARRAIGTSRETLTVAASPPEATPKVVGAFSFLNLRKTRFSAQLVSAIRDA